MDKQGTNGQITTVGQQEPLYEDLEIPCHLLQE
jgi:hypothetical protein